jgi:peptidase E
MAADGRRHVLAIGGGMLMPRDTVPLHLAYSMELSGKPEPRLCVLNTAMGDDASVNLRFYDRLAQSRARVRHLSLFPMPNVDDPEDLLMSQDVIFVGGGSVANMVAVWRAHAIDEIMRKAWQAGIVLAGSSAGGICWFEGGTTDSFGIKLRAFTDGLGMLAGSFCPHFNSEPERRPLYHRAVAEGTLPGGIACDDGVGAHFVDETLSDAVADRPEGGAYRVERAGDGVVETPLDTRFLGDLAGASLWPGPRLPALTGVHPRGGPPRGVPGGVPK